jgi:hypothetical protein
VTAWGSEIKFRKSSFEVLPQAAAAYVIAHELAHVYQKCLGRHPGGRDDAENERHADLLAKGWGFCPTVYDLIRLLEKAPGRDFRSACAEVKKLGFR